MNPIPSSAYRSIQLLALIVAVVLSAPAQQSARPAAAYPPLPDWISIQRDIHYDRYPATILDVLQPKKRAAAKAPAVVVFHGGGWIHSEIGRASCRERV